MKTNVMSLSQKWLKRMKSSFHAEGHRGINNKNQMLATSVAFLLFRVKRCSRLYRFTYMLALSQVSLLSHLEASILNELQTTVTSAVNASAKLKPKRKKVLIFTCNGGGGHMTATSAITDYLRPDYDIVSINITGELLKGYDFIKMATFSAVDAEDFYNWLLRNNLYWLSNLYTKTGAIFTSWLKESITKIFLSYLEQNKVDLLISVMPLINGSSLDAAQQLNIPFILIPTDIDAHTFVNGMKAPRYGKFHYFMAFDDPQVREKIAFADLLPEQITVSGFPIRPSFFEKKNIPKIKQDFGIPADKKVVMILMGASGSRACQKYVKRLIKSKTPMHIVACVGRSEDLRTKISALEFPPHISISTVGFTTRIADLMAVANVLITKTGTCSFCEGIYSGVPMILDNIYGSLEVEAFNLEFARKYKLGDVVTGYRWLNKIVDKYLLDPEYDKTIRANIAQLPKGDFPTALRTQVAKMIYS